MSLSIPLTTRRKRDTLRTCALLTQGAVFAAVGVAALGKLQDVTVFMRGMNDWSLIPAAAIPALGFALPAFEVWLVTRFFLGIQRSRTVALTTGLIAAFTALYFVETVVQATPPNCACIGLWENYYEGLSTGKAVLVRNALLALALTGSQLLIQRRDARAGANA